MGTNGVVYHLLYIQPDNGGVMRPKQFNGICEEHLNQDEEGRVILEAFTMQELWVMVQKFTKTRKRVGRKKAEELLTEYFNQKANNRLNN